MVAVKFSQEELRELVSATPNFETLINELKKNPDFDVEIIETSGACITYYGDESYKQTKLKADHGKEGR